MKLIIEGTVEEIAGLVSEVQSQPVLEEKMREIAEDVQHERSLQLFKTMGHPIAWIEAIDENYKANKARAKLGLPAEPCVIQP